MIQEEINEGNKLIADFMQIKTELISPYGIGIPRLYSMQEEHQTEEGDCTELSYDCSWDWLMPVVEKLDRLDISNLNLKNANCIHTEIAGSHIKICIREHHTGTDYDYHFIYFKNGYSDNDSKIEAIWIAVVEFIKWYNKNKEK
jgi:hypothetical protein